MAFIYFSILSASCASTSGCASENRQKRRAGHGGPPLEFERPIPPSPWRGMTVVVCFSSLSRVVCLGILNCRSIGYGPTLNDNEDLWTLLGAK